VEQLDFMPFDPITKRTEGAIRDLSTGEEYRTSKGAPHVIMQLCGNEEVRRKCEADVTALGQRGVRSLAVARTDSEGKTWSDLGLYLIRCL
jgi:H+-transporting ATPase